MNKNDVNNATKSIKKRDYSYTQNRELSWLKFNQRVLEEATDTNVPLLERLNFISIFTSNFDEFFMIRCGSLYDLTLIDKNHRDNKTNLTAHEQLVRIFEASKPLYEQRDQIYSVIQQELRSQGIIQHKFETLNSEQRKYATQYFHENVSPLLSPQIIDAQHPFPHLINKKLFIYLVLGEDHTDNVLGIVPVPNTLSRFIKFPNSEDYILIEDLLYSFADELYKGYVVKYKTIAAVTRNADVNLQKTPIDEDEDYRHYMKNILKKRNRLAPIRLEIYSYKHHKYNKFLRQRLNLHKNQVFTTETPINMDYIPELINTLPKTLKHELSFAPFKGQLSPKINPNKSILKRLEHHDILLNYPYETMDQFLQFLKEVANDPEVISVKISLYRVARSSSIIKYLLEAVENGKDVIVLIELRARFDEKNNIHYAELLEEAGCQVLYGFEEYKVHCKVCTVIKKHKNKLIQYTQVGTGNYNEKTSRFYTDLAYLTSKQEIGDDANELFKNIAVSNSKGIYKKLLVPPHDLRKQVISKIDAEIEKTKQNKPAEILLKMNSLTDRKIIDKLVIASQHGVKVRMVIRGICCVVPGIPGKTENIEVHSIVGRFLEHSRVYVFGKEDPEVYISSADFMTRNTKKRIEVACPIEDDELKNRIIHILNIMLEDDIKGRRIDNKGDYERIKNGKGLNSQQYFVKEAIEESKKVIKREQNRTFISKLFEKIKEKLGLN